MNNMDYLNQIAGSVQSSAAGGKQRLLSPLMIKIIVVGVALLIVLIVVGAMLGGLASKATDVAKQIDVRMTNLMAAEETYGKEVKSPRLRSLSDTMNGVMTDTTQKLGVYLDELDGFEVSKASGQMADDEAEVNEELLGVLENARLNGLLDETFVREMSLQITLLLSMESEVMERSKDDELVGIMEKSSESLQVIQSNLENL